MAWSRFDLMSFTWLPEQCYYRELESEFPWYHDNEGTREADEDMVSRSKHETLFVTWDYHETYCAFMWQPYHGTVYPFLISI